MKNLRLLALSIAWILVSASELSAHDLSKYREFQMGMSLATVASQAAISPEPRVLQERPALIQELMWQPPRVLRLSPDGDSVRKVLFSFYNGQLFRMVVTYDRDRTEGLTAADMIDAISATYGEPLLAATPLMPSGPSVPAGRATAPRWQEVPYSRSVDYEDKILARWDDSENAIYLFQSPYESGFGLVVSSKSRDALARAAVTEAARLDVLEAPQREIERQQKRTEDNRLKNETARHANKQTFRP
jgi:hypothetical protein